MVYFWVLARSIIIVFIHPSGSLGQSGILIPIGSLVFYGLLLFFLARSCTIGFRTHYGSLAVLGFCCLQGSLSFDGFHVQSGSLPNRWFTLILWLAHTRWVYSSHFGSLQSIGLHRQGGSLLSDGLHTHSGSLSIYGFLSNQGSLFCSGLLTCRLARFNIAVYSSYMARS